MTKGKVIRAFRCANSSIHYSLGTIYEADSERIESLVIKGYLEPIVAHIPKAEVITPTKKDKPLKTSKKDK